MIYRLNPDTAQVFDSLGQTYFKATSLKVKCERHGNCEVCATHHTDGKSAPYCQRK
jgi:hypothetical protein